MSICSEARQELAVHISPGARSVVCVGHLGFCSEWPPRHPFALVSGASTGGRFAVERLEPGGNAESLDGHNSLLNEGYPLGETEICKAVC